MICWNGINDYIDMEIIIRYITWNFGWIIVVFTRDRWLKAIQVMKKLY